MIVQRLFLLAASLLPAASAFAPSSLSSSPRHVRHLAVASSLESDAAVVVNGDAATESQSTPTTQQPNKQKRLAILLCPAQFCVPVDYEELLATIQTHPQSNVEVVATCVAPLPRTEWIKVAKQLPTKNFLDANLSVKVTLDWYFDAMETALADLFAEGGDDVEVCVIGHSIGGWVARAYLGGLSR